ncbi:hypothetical protein M404DRAFT_1002958 [Pisolithus tinctorius Marx 270]|uniref:Uncharacterized protein n=1 Tax=Pisolithus tinctorius Marx 270 TaxID=870435 RepID=A0A0C3NKQ4_PISTI|nr:hypothetical protein M404DRAFT_1002958 [Pisolithus tinctorius Marx 270]
MNELLIWAALPRIVVSYKQLRIVHQFVNVVAIVYVRYLRNVLCQWPRNRTSKSYEGILLRFLRGGELVEIRPSVQALPASSTVLSKVWFAGGEHALR